MLKPNLEIQSSEKDLKKNLKIFFDDLKAEDIVLLSGPMGSGKTTLVTKFVEYKQDQSAFAAMDIKANSPSYNLIHEYKLKDLNIVHIDLYRIESEADLESTGFWDVMQSKNSIFFIEWPDKISKSELTYNRLINLEIRMDKINSITNQNRTYSIKH